MDYEIREQLLAPGREHNRPGTPLRPIGICLHETADPGATDEDEARYFGAGYRGASAHYFVDADSITRLIPEDEVAWGAGPTANARYIHVEQCHYGDHVKFAEVWIRTVWLVADIGRRHAWDLLVVGSSPIVVTHDWCRQQWHETTHTDPTGYWAAHGKTLDEFRTAARGLMPAQATTITALVDGHPVPAVLVGDKSYIAARELAGVLGYSVAWDSATQRVVLSRP